MRIAVTGANGNAGWNVVRALLSKQVTIRACVSETKRAEFKRSFQDLELSRACEDFVDFASLDLYQPSTFDNVLQGCDGLFLMRPPSISDTKATLNVLIDRARANGVKRIVFLSVDGAEKNTLVPHHAVERHLITTQQHWYGIVRPGFFAQNLEDAYIKDIVEDHRIIAPAGDALVNFVDLLDVGEVVAKLLLDPNQPSGQGLTLTGPEPVTFAYVAQCLTQTLGTRVTYHPVSVPAYFMHLWRKRQLPLMHAVVQTFLHFRLRYGDGATVTDEIEKMLGRPPTSIDEYVSRRRTVFTM